MLGVTPFPYEVRWGELKWWRRYLRWAISPNDDLGRLPRTLLAGGNLSWFGVLVWGGWVQN